MPLVAVAPRPSPYEDAPWVQTLDAFGVPFLLYGHDGRRDEMSPSAAAVFSGHDRAASLLVAADRLAGDAIARRDPRFHFAPFFLVQDIDVPAAGVRLGAYLLGVDAAPWCAAVVVSPRLRSDTAAIDALSRRENEVARLIGVGMSTKEIGRRLGISPHTARHHTERIFVRLGVTTRAGVAAIVGEQRARRSESRPIAV